MRKQKIVRLAITLLAAAVLMAGIMFGLRYQSGRYARAQAESVARNDPKAIYGEFASEIQNHYTSEDDFLDTFGMNLLTQPIKEIKLKSRKGNVMGGEYKYYLVRVDDTSIGYILDVDVAPGLWGKKIKDITIQPVRFLEEQ